MDKRKGKHLSLTERLVIERMYLQKRPVKEIARAIGRCPATIYNELKRATYVHSVELKEEIRYAPETAHQKYLEMLKRKGRKPKLAIDKEQSKILQKIMIENKYSPRTAMKYAQAKGIVFQEPVYSVNTIYKAIKDGLFEKFSFVKVYGADYRKGHKKQKKRKVIKSLPKGESIEQRDKEILKRESFGHWEMDTVKGKRSNQCCLLVLTERKTRYEIIEKIRHCTTDEVRKALNRIEKQMGRYFYSVFKTITVDNGSEFKDYCSMQKALYRKGDRTKVFYCHPYTPSERGSNENINKLIRRFFPKGSDFDDILKLGDIRKVQSWINNLPREILNWTTASSLFYKEVSLL